MFLMFPRDHKGVSLQASPESRTRKYKRVLRRSLVRFLAASLAGYKGVWFFCYFPVPRRQIDPGNNSRYFFSNKVIITWHDGAKLWNYGWLLLTLIFRLGIRKKESGRPQAAVLFVFCFCFCFFVFSSIYLFYKPFILYYKIWRWRCYL